MFEKIKKNTVCILNNLTNFWSLSNRPVKLRSIPCPATTKNNRDVGLWGGKRLQAQAWNFGFSIYNLKMNTVDVCISGSKFQIFRSDTYLNLNQSPELVPSLTIAKFA